VNSSSNGMGLLLTHWRLRVIHTDKKDDETLEDIEEELTKEEKEAEMEDEAENKELDKEGFIDGTGTKDTGDEDDQQTIVPESDGGMHDMQDMTMEPHEIPSEVDRKKVWTGEGEGMGMDMDMDMDMEMGDDDINNEPPPVPSPTHQNAPVQPAPSSNHIFSACSGLSCPLVNAYQDHPLPVLVVLALVPLFLLCCLRKYCCRSKSAGDARGAYRAVAARYGDMAYDNTFSDTLSDDEDDDFHNGNGDIEDDSWGRSGKRSLQMSNLGRKRNDGLSLEEMNG
jgi:hypothetical protein